MTIKILKLPNVLEKTGLSRSNIYKMIQQDQFPSPIKLGPNARASGWIEDEIHSWINTCIENRNNEKQDGASRSTPTTIEGGCNEK